MKNTLKAALDRIQQVSENEVTGTSTGFKGIDSVTHGLHSGELTIVGFRRCLSASAFLLNSALNISKKSSVFYISCKDSKDIIGSSILSIGSGLNQKNIRNAAILDDDWPLIVATVKHLSKNPNLKIEYCPKLTTSSLESMIRDSLPLELVIIDNLQQLEITTDTQLADFLKGLKKLALELDIPILVSTSISFEQEKSKSYTFSDDPRLEAYTDTSLLFSNNLFNEKSTVEGDIEITVTNRANYIEQKLYYSFDINGFTIRERKY